MDRSTPTSRTRRAGLLIVGIVFIALLTTAFTGLPRLRFTSDYRVFFQPDYPQLQAYRALEETYDLADNILFVVDTGNEGVFTPRTLNALAWFTEQAWQLPHVSRVDSLTNFQNTRARGDDLVVQDLYEPDTARPATTDLQQLRHIALGEPLLRNRLIAPSAQVTAINVNFDLPAGQADALTPVVVAAARQLAHELEQRQPHLKVHLTGMLMFNNAYPEATQHDGQSLVPAMFGIIILLLLVTLRHLGATLITLAITLLAIVTALGISGHAGITLNTASATAPLIIMTLCVANAVHILRGYLDRFCSHGDRHAALDESLQRNFRPILITNLLTAIGFLTLNFSDSPPFHDLGNITAIGVLAGWLYSMTLLPAALRHLPFRAPAGRSASGHGIVSSLADFVITRWRRLLVAGGLLSLLLMAAIPLNRLDDTFVEDFSTATAFRQDTDFTLSRLTGLYTMEYHLPAGGPGGIYDPDYLQTLDDFARWFSRQPEVLHVAAFTDILKRLNMNLHGDDPDHYRVPPQRDQAAQYVLLYEMSLPYGLDLNNRVAVGKDATRLTVVLDNIGSEDILALEARARRWLAEHGPAGMNVAPSSPALMFAHISRQNVRNMLLGTALSLVLISLIMILALRDVKLGLFSLVPNLLPLGATFGIWGLLVGEIGLAASTVSAICLGIIVDDTVHFLSKYQWFRHEQGLPPEAAIRQTFQWVGGAMTTTTLVLTGGFAVLAFSRFAINAEIGLLTAMTLVLAWFADIFLLPALLLWLERRRTVPASAIASTPHRAPPAPPQRA